MIELTLPFPPTINHYYGNRKNGAKYIKPKGQQFRRLVNVIVKKLYADQKLNFNLAVEIDVYPPDKRKRDIDNILKALLDALTHANVYVDDSLIKKLTINWQIGGIAKDGRVDVFIKQKVLT